MSNTSLSAGADAAHLARVAQLQQGMEELRELCRRLDEALETWRDERATFHAALDRLRWIRARRSW